MTTTGFRILLLEDDPADAGLVTRLLRRARPQPFVVTLATRLSEARELLGEEGGGFDVVLADLGLPDSAGIATLDALTGRAPHLPVVVMTGNDDDVVALEAVKRGAQDYLVKGAGDGFILSRVIRYAIERKAAEAALRQARDVAERAARAKTVFLAMMGHEIRTPLNGVLGMARLLLESPLDPRQRTHVDTLVSSGELLLGLVNDILDFARLDVDGLSLEQEEFDLAETVEEVRLVLAARAHDKGLALVCRLAPSLARRVVGDRLRLRQILFNLVGNAIKFTDQGGVTVTVAADPSGPHRLRFSVSDTGIGIPPEVGGALFDEFWQGDSGADRRFSGAGLGLAICKRLASLMGGEIGYRSDPGQGSTFHVDLPFPPAQSQSPPPPAPPMIEPPPRKILLVDDNEVNCQVAAGLLERRGHRVVIAADGRRAIMAARTGGFDLILLDLRMPEMDGIAVAQAIRALPGAAGAVPIHLLTAYPGTDDESRWREAGIQGCLSKPFRVEDILRLLAVPHPSPVAETPPPLVALVDLAVDLRDLGHERMVGLADLFRRSSGADLEKLQEQARQGRWSEAGATAHRMAGAAASLHLRPLSQRCRAIDQAARSQDTARAAALTEGIDRLWTQSLDALIAALTSPDPNASTLEKNA